MLNLEDVKASLKEFYEDCGDSSWLEGWICGMTDADHGHENGLQAHEELLDYLGELRAASPQNC